jgi:DNA adenine methylase
MGGREPTRPLLRWHGGKWILAPWIISHFPPHRVYVEPFGGAASVLIRKPRSYAEVYNDLDDDVVNLFRVLRNDPPENGHKLIDHLIHTPFARKEFDDAYLPTDDPVEAARRLIIRSFMGFGSDGHNGARPTGFRANSNKSGTTPAHDWSNYPDALEIIISRLNGVVVEHRPALDVITQHDGPETLFYVDPPYVWATRSKAHNSSKKNYRHELSDAEHEQLLDKLLNVAGKVVLSGYDTPLYAQKLGAWYRTEKTALADGARERTEVLWLNPAAAAGIASPTLFGAAA